MIENYIDSLLNIIKTNPEKKEIIEKGLQDIIKRLNSSINKKYKEVYSLKTLNFKVYEHLNGYKFFIQNLNTNTLGDAEKLLSFLFLNLDVAYTKIKPNASETNGAEIRVISKEPKKIIEIVKTNYASNDATSIYVSAKTKQDLFKEF